MIKKKYLLRTISATPRCFFLLKSFIISPPKKFRSCWPTQKVENTNALYVRISMIRELFETFCRFFPNNYETTGEKSRLIGVTTKILRPLLKSIPKMTKTPVKTLP